MGVDQGGYISNPDGEKAKLERVVQACLDLGIYVIIDWHLEASDAHVDKAKPFFSEMAQKYGHYPNVLFETWNEPKYVSWSTIKAYHEQVVGAIRQYSNNICILGNPTWSSEPDTAAKDPVPGENLAYTVHFYAASNRSPGRIQGALDAGHAVWATEWGTCESSGNGRVDTNSAAQWMSFLDAHGISSTNWAIEDKAESCAALTGGASSSGGWSDSQLTESGLWVRNTIRAGSKELNSTIQALQHSIMV
jgi:endoglucanase